MKLTLETIRRSVAILAIASAMVIWSATAVFLYRHVYRTLTQVDTEIDLTDAREILEPHTTLFRALEDAHAFRHAKQLPNWQDGRNPFLGKE